MTVWFDVEDLFDYARAGHRRVTGIQRLTLEIYRAAVAAAPPGAVGFVRHGTGSEMFVVLDWGVVGAPFPPPSDPARAGPRGGSWGSVVPRTALRRLARRGADLMPVAIRGPAVLAAVTQVQVVAQLGLFAAGMVGHVAHAGLRSARRRLAVPVRAAFPRLGRARLRARADRPSFAAVARPGDTLLVLGSPWFRHRYSTIARWLRDERRIRFGVMLCDLVPVRRPEWCDEGVRRNFAAWYSDVLPLCDLVLAISRYTAADVEDYAGELGIALKRPVRAIPIGTGFGTAPPPGPALPPGALPDLAPAIDPGDRRGARRPPPAPGTYVLFVSTLEARKNHALMVEVWRRLLREVRAGTRTAESVPDLVFAGRVGWLVHDLVQQLDNSDWLGGRVRLVDGPSDAELQRLYDGCLFTVFPSFFEGWGLPVTESLARGAPCLCSTAASLPEAGGALARYFDPDSVGSARDAVAALIDDRPALHAWRDQVRQEFRPVPWTDTAAAVLEEAVLDGALLDGALLDGAGPPGRT